MRQLFIYYRIDVADEPSVRSQLRGLQRQLMESHPGLQARSLIRGEQEPAAHRTVMEIYARPGRPGGVDDECQAAIAAAAAGLAPLIRSPRHVEVFLPFE